MCYYVSQKPSPIEIAKHYKADVQPELALDYKPYYLANGFAHPKLTVLTQHDGLLQADLMQWGLMNNWKKPYAEMLKMSHNTLNAKSETIFDLVSFKSNILTRRCIVPVDNFFEYKHTAGDKLPYAIHPKKQPFFNLAGVFAYYQDPADAFWHKTFSICTAPANALMSTIHNTKFRQPVIIADAQVNDWLNPNASKAELTYLMQPCDDDAMAAYPVDRNLIKMGNVAEVLGKVE